jgi:hypothetical protein
MKENEIGKACSTHERNDRCIESFGRKRKGKWPLARPRRRWGNNIRINLIEVGWKGVEWIHLAQDRD